MSGSYCVSKKSRVSHHIIFITVFAHNVRLQHERQRVDLDATRRLRDMFLRDVACQKLLKSANVSRSYSQNNTRTVFLRHGVCLNFLKLCIEYCRLFFSFFPNICIMTTILNLNFFEANQPYNVMVNKISQVSSKNN